MPSYRKTISLLLILVFCLSVAGLVAGYLLLPSIIEKKAQENVLFHTPLTDFKLAVEKAWLYGLRIADVEAGKAGNKALSVRSIDIRFSPLHLFERKIKKIEIEELKLFIDIKDGQVSIPGLESPALADKDEPAPMEINIPLYLQELQIKKSILQITVDEDQIQIPFQLTARPKGQNLASFTVLLQLYPGPEQLSVGADIDLSQNLGNLSFSSLDLELDVLAPIVRKIPGLEISGRASLNGSSEIKLQPAEVISAGVKIDLQPFAFAFNDIKIQSTNKKQQDLPLKLSFDYIDGNIRYQAEDIILTEPVTVGLYTSGTLDISEVQLAGAGDVKLAVQQLPSLEIKDHLRLFADVAYWYDRSTGDWHFNLAKSSSAPTEIFRVQYQDANFRINEPAYTISGKGVDGSGDVSFSAALPQISIAQNDILGKGILELNGNLHIDAEGMNGEILAAIQKGRLEFTEDNYVIEDIALSAHFPVLPQLKTAPNQEFRFSKASLGELAFTDGIVSWQLESEDTLLIENSVFKWAGGNIYANDIRLIHGKEEQFIKIICDRLDLIEVLQHFGMKNPEGEGTISGNIPLHIGKKTIKFENGMLSSSQGEGGKIKIGAFELLTAGIPKNTPQFAQVDFAAEALKNFNYDWVKLFLNSEGDDLVMQLQMYGKPVQSLPFKYDSATGLLQRDENVKQGIYQPIRLDVNFRFPLNRLIGYSGKILDIMDQIK